ncbi:MAG: hypothetical protein M5U20_08210 [Phycisphaerales bacterium]|nr:hypothetical protein [Phycisphaerales bacterium]
MATTTVDLEVRLRRARLVRLQVIALVAAANCIPSLRRTVWCVILEHGPARLTSSRRFFHTLSLRLRRGELPRGEVGFTIRLDDDGASVGD